MSSGSGKIEKISILLVLGILVLALNVYSLQSIRILREKLPIGNLTIVVRGGILGRRGDVLVRSGVLVNLSIEIRSPLSVRLERIEVIALDQSEEARIESVRPWRIEGRVVMANLSVESSGGFILRIETDRGIFERRFEAVDFPPIVGRRYRYEDILERCLEFSERGARLRVIGRSVEGRSIPMLMLGSGEKRIVVVAQHHGDERLSSQVALELAEILLDERRDLLERATFYIVPIVNPDGTERLRGVERLNYSIFLTSRKNARGVDLNRNYPVDWERGSGDPDSPVYRGPEPLSEPETRAIAELLREVKPDLAISLHSTWDIEKSGRYVDILICKPPVASEREYEPILRWVKKELEKRGFDVFAGSIGEAYNYPIAGGSFENYAHSLGSMALLIEIPEWTSPEFKEEYVGDPAGESVSAGVEACLLLSELVIKGRVFDLRLFALGILLVAISLLALLALIRKI